MAIRIELEVDSKESDKRFDSLNEKLDVMERAQEALNKALSTSGSAASRAASGYDKIARSADRAARATRAVKAPPFADPAAVREANRVGALSGDVRAMKLFEESNRQMKREARIRRAAHLAGAPPIVPPPVAQQTDVAALLQRAWNRTRFDSSGRGFPLGVDIATILRTSPGSLSALFGTGKAVGGARAAVAGGGGAGAGGAAAGAGRLASAGPIGAVVAAAIAAVVSWTAALKFSIRRMNELSQEALVTGSAPGSTGALRNIAGMLGTSGSSLAARVSSGVSSGPGLVVAARAGINPVTNPLVGDIDMGEKVRKVTAAIAAARSFEEAQRMAMAVGAPELAQVYLLSKNNKRAMTTRSTSVTRSDIANIADMQAGIARLAESVKKIAVLPLRPMLAILGRILEVINMIIEPIANAAQKIGDRTTRGLRKVLGLDDADKGLASDPHSRQAKTFEGVEGAVRENTGALKENSALLKDMRSIFGHGARTGGAVPTALRYGALDDFYSSQSRKLGVV